MFFLALEWKIEQIESHDKLPLAITPTEENKNHWAHKQKSPLDFYEFWAPLVSGCCAWCVCMENEPSYRYSLILTSQIFKH